MPKYNLKDIETQLTEAKKNGTNYKDKWEEIAAFYGVSRSAVYRWYYRAKKKAEAQATPDTVTLAAGKNSIVIEKNSDYYRFIMYLLTGKTNRQTINEIKGEINSMMPMIEEQAGKPVQYITAPPMPPKSKNNGNSNDNWVEKPQAVPQLELGQSPVQKLLAHEAREFRKKLVTPPKGTIHHRTNKYSKYEN